MKPLVSIAIPTFNRSKLLKKCVESVANQDYDNVEIIISDNASTDDTQQVIESLIERYPHRQIKYFRNSSNIGLANNWRKAIMDRSLGEIGLILSDDDFFVEQSFITKSVGIFLKDKKIFVVVASQYFYDPRSEKLTLDCVPLDPKMSAEYVIMNYWEMYKNGVIHFPMTTTFFRRDLLDAKFMLHDVDIISADAELFMMMLFKAMTLNGYVACIQEMIPAAYYQQETSASQTNDVDVLWRDNVFIHNVAEYAKSIGVNIALVDRWESRMYRLLVRQIRYLTMRQVYLGKRFDLSTFVKYCYKAYQINPKYGMYCIQPRNIAYYLLSRVPRLYKKVIKAP